MSAENGAVPRGPLDTPLAITFFENYAAGTKREEAYTLRALANRVRTVTANRKADLPWLKLARFGDQRTDKNSLRHDDNVLAISGIEADYDSEKIHPQDAADKLEQAGIAALVYTSPSHTEDSPRWRILCPISHEMPGAHRAHLVGRLNGLFAGTLAGESFAMSQSYYFGSVQHNPSHQTILVDGSHIDEHDELDEIWLGRPNTVAREPGSPQRSGHVNLSALLAEIMTGDGYHVASVRIAGLLARQSTPFMEAREKLVEAMQAVPESQRDRRWADRFSDIDRTLIDIYGKEARKRDKSPPPPEPPDGHDDPGYWATVESDGMSEADWHTIEQREGGVPVKSSPEARAKAGHDVLWSLLEPWEEKDIPTRPWIARGYIMRGAVTVLSGPGSAGKSSLVVAWAAALTLNREFHRFPATGFYRVCTYNVEDDENEQKRRFSAIFRQMGMTPGDTEHRLAILGPRRVGTLLSLNSDGTVLVNTPVMDKLEEFIIEFKPDVVILDPFVELHAAEENDNTAIRAVMARFRSMSYDHNIGIVLLHHSRKGLASPGDPDSLRGASAIVGAARVALTINVMTEDEAKSFGLPIDGRRDYFRMDGAKSNYARIEDAEWFERIEHHLDNGDGVAAASAWIPPNLAPKPEQVDGLLTVIAAGSPSGLPWSDRLSASEPRSIRHALMRLGIDSAARQKAAMVAAIASGAIIHAEFQRPGKAKTDRARGLRTLDGRPDTVNWHS